MVHILWVRTRPTLLSPDGTSASSQLVLASLVSLLASLGLLYLFASRRNPAPRLADHLVFDLAGSVVRLQPSTIIYGSRPRLVSHHRPRVTGLAARCSRSCLRLGIPCL